MQKFYILIIFLVAIKFGFYNMAVNKNLKNINPQEKKEIQKEVQMIGSVYHPTTSQTDPTPTVTANQSVIDTIKLRLNKIRWVALSLNLFKKNGGEFKFNDIVIVKSEFKEINGEWIVKDVLPSRKNGIDFLQHPKTGFYGLYKNITIKKKI